MGQSTVKPFIIHNTQEWGGFVKNREKNIFLISFERSEHLTKLLQYEKIEVPLFLVLLMWQTHNRKTCYQNESKLSDSSTKHGQTSQGEEARTIARLIMTLMLRMLLCIGKI